MLSVIDEVKHSRAARARQYDRANRPIVDRLSDATWRQWEAQLMKVPGWLAAVVLGALAFVVGLVLQLTGFPHLGLAISMVGVMVATVGGMCRPRRSH
jgi:hypothetical protein